ncbi:hypothetical protein FOC1_g10007673 [Fusarium oxysporum f. sp. cubense race 1]|uniref:Uncharacterized protein n=1 Tax=Fusarium oxysporum f. sp. cubense (strain race 1) TaxID=1229664 RepID=N4URL7_FUSC1|nr:hypothetical protein FOC1_g10007673 [Fusarium oxysporum f. sp. cubense race 1]
MAEAFGIAGSAFGTVSSGLQLFKEISQYLDDIDGREEDLKQARNFATNIQISINALDVAVSNAPNDDLTTKNAIDLCKVSCVSAVNNLLAVVKELRGPIISVPNSNAARTKELCAKLKYPFKKQNIEKLEENLSRTNSALQTILQVVQLRNLWGPFLVEAEIRSRDHHAPECPMSKLPAATRQTKRVLNFSIPTLQNYYGRASKVSFSYTTGAGILGFGQTLTWITTVDEKSSPVFRLVQMMEIYNRLPRKDMRILLASCLRRLVWCYVNYHASVTDVNKSGDSIIEWALEHYHLSGSLATLDADNMADLFQMLSVVTKPATYPRRVTVGSYRLFQSFPQVAESLEFGPLSQAILKQDRNGVQQLLERCPSYLNEVNYCGQSPIHLAIETQNMDVISVILQYANTKALHVMDNMGRYPIVLATPAIGKHTERVQASCSGFKVLEIILRLKTALFPSSLQLGFMPSRSHGGKCTQGHKILIKGLAERREGLKELAYQNLSPIERQDLEIHQARVLDKNAARVQQQLEAQGCAIPMYLKVYEANAESSDAQRSIYSYICSGEVAEYARQLGFYYSSNELADYISTLATLMGTTDCHAYIYTPFSCSYFSWMIDQGTNVSSRIQSRQLPTLETELTIAHYFMGSYGMMIRDEQGRMGKISEYQWIYTAIIRYHTSAILELRHACCCIIQNPSGPLSEEERREIQEEDSFLLELLKNLIAEFEDKRVHGTRLEDFFEWMRIVWVPRMREAEQELAAQSLTAQQLRDAEAIGVVLKVHRPLLMNSSSRVVELVEGDLWDAMDELDKIATDPERPMKE